MLLSEVETILSFDHEFPFVVIQNELWESGDGFAMGSPVSAG